MVAALPHNYGTLGRYVLLGILGQGGMGVVWEAYDPVLDRKIALKLIPGASARGQIVGEAQAMGRIQHPNVVVVHDAGVHPAGDHDLTYVAMELVGGGTLKQWLENPSHSLEERLDRFLLAGAGLEAAHLAGLVHRDFKPSNVLLGEDGRVRVSDFGLALMSGEASSGDGSERSPRAGTPRYMSPEQLDGLPADARSDQFAFCVALYEAIFGAHPFAPAGNDTPPPRPSGLEPQLPSPRSRLAARLAPIIMRGLAADPSRRWPSMGELLAALGRARRRPGRRAALLATAILSALLAVGAVGWQRAATSRACRRQAGAVDATWSSARRSSLAAAFGRLGALGTAVWPRLQAALDDWTSRWRALRLEECEADHDGASPSVSLSARRECFDRRLGELDGLVRALDGPDETVARYAVRAAHELTPPESCLSALPPSQASSQPPARDRVTRVRAEIDHATALRLLGKLRPARDEAKRAADEAARIGWDPLSADAQLELGNGFMDASSAAPATDAFYRAWWSAETARDDALRFEATVGLFKIGLQVSDYSGAERWVQTAKAIAHHLPADPARAARLDFLEMRLALYSGKYHECIQTGEQGLRTALRAAPNTQLHVMILMNLARCEGALDHDEVGDTYLHRALAISEKINGHIDQQTASLLTDLGIHERHAHHNQAALTDYREALSIREQMAGPDDPNCAAVHNNIGNVLRDEGRYDDANREHERAIAIWTKAWGPDSPAVAAALNGLGRTAMAEGQPAKAEPLFRRALEIRKKKRPAGHPDILASMELVGQALLAQRKREALPLLQEALAGAEHDANSPP
ncbi:MAG TPA: serine/threonine-protein kinase, partial [Polyangia bacterium]